MAFGYIITTHPLEYYTTGIGLLVVFAVVFLFSLAVKWIRHGRLP
jgi:hypothetical protein